MGNMYGYARVSTKEQNLDRQLIALTEFGIAKENVFFEKESGKDFNRPVYQNMLTKLKEGDTIVIKSLDRLGRDYKEIKEQWHYLMTKKKVFIVVLDMRELDTDGINNLMKQFLVDNMLNLTAYMAETERLNTLQRQKEGIAAAKKRGVKFGRPRKPLPEQFMVQYEKWKNDDISARKAAKRLNMNVSTFLNRAKELKNTEK